MNRDKQNRHDRIAPELVWPLEFRSFVAKHNDRADGERREQRNNYTDVSKQRSPSIGKKKQTCPDRLEYDRIRRRAKCRMDMSQPFKKSSIPGHRVVNPRTDH